jgi:hypothetical protein
MREPIVSLESTGCWQNCALAVIAEIKKCKRALYKQHVCISEFLLALRVLIRAFFTQTISDKFDVFF